MLSRQIKVNRLFVNYKTKISKQKLFKKKVFEEMKKAYDKCKKLTEKDGHFKTYIRAMAELEMFVNEVKTTI